MTEIILPKREFGQGTIQINLNKYLPEEGEKKSLVNLSNEELAQLSPEELERAKQVSANLLAIIQNKKEVETMESQVRWTAAVQVFAKEHGISEQEAEEILKKRAGINSPTDLAAILAALKPEPNPLERALSAAITQRMNDIAPLLFGKPPGDTGGEAAQAALTKALQQAKQFGAKSIYLPDGSVVKLAEDGGGNQDTIMQGASAQIRQYVENIVNQRLPTLFNPPPATGGLQVDPGANPEIVKLFLEDQSRQEDRKAADARSERRDSAIKDIAAMIGAAFSPEGFPKLQRLLKEGPAGVAAAGKQVETEAKKEVKKLRATCWKCLKAFPYEEGQDPVCPFCGQAQKVECPQCENIFIPTNRNRIECPNCHAELQKSPEEKGNQPPSEKLPPSESLGPNVSVGAGLE